jgi:hypothetical protein
MYKGYRNRLLAIDKTVEKQKKGIETLDYINKCSKCRKLNFIFASSTLTNVQICIFCGNPFYIIKPPN